MLRDNRLNLVILVCCGVLMGMQGRCSKDASSGPAPAPTTVTSPQAPADGAAKPVHMADVAIALKPAFEHATLQMPVWLEEAPGAPGVWYAVQQPGTVVRFSADGGKPTVVLNLRDRVVSGGERGLLGLAFHPDFATNGQIVVNYTAESSGKLETRVSRFKTRDGGKSFDAKSEDLLLRFDQPFANHNGGQVGFGPDGLLYIAVGDGGSAGDPEGNGQNPATLLGAFLRIDVDRTEGDLAYGIPPKNPFAAARQEGRPEIFAWGVRNPWRFSWDRKTGELWAGDVGQNQWEEIDRIEVGKNYGWRVREGHHCYDPPTDCPAEGFTEPVLEYGRKLGKSVTGGYVYRGQAITGLQGHYVFGDFVSGRIWAHDIAAGTTRELLDTDLNISTFAEGSDGELYVVNYGAGTIFKLSNP